MGQRCVIAGGIVIWGLVLAGSLAAQPAKPTPQAEAAKLKNPTPSNAASVATGQQLYQKYCRFCHGADGAGNATMKDMKPSNLTDATWDRGSTDGEIFIVIQEGAGPEYKMKGLKGKISDQDTWHIVNYVRSLGAKK